MISLKIQRQLFQKKLLLLGYSYKITQYEDFIKSIQRIVLNDLKSSMDNLEEKIKEIYGSLDMPSTYFIKKEDILKIKKSYLVKLIEDGLLDLYLEIPKIRVYDKTIQKQAYRIVKGKSILINGKPILRDAPSIRINKCIINNGIHLNEEDIRHNNHILKRRFIESGYIKQMDSINEELKLHSKLFNINIEYLFLDIHLFVNIENIDELIGDNKVEIIVPEKTRIVLRKIEKVYNIHRNNINNMNDYYRELTRRVIEPMFDLEIIYKINDKEYNINLTDLYKKSDSNYEIWSR